MLFQEADQELKAPRKKRLELTEKVVTSIEEADLSTGAFTRPANQLFGAQGKVEMRIPEDPKGKRPARQRPAGQREPPTKRAKSSDRWVAMGLKQNELADIKAHDAHQLVGGFASVSITNMRSSATFCPAALRTLRGTQRSSCRGASIWSSQGFARSRT